ncbi:type 2 lanthipeptide synthetase LanM [Pseudomonas alkylphenolica]|uniref:type 2 lanthipeptide synthetase LanM n=1 Tax=Pseudomonas alkylphenolica TaxID=237609 RepID=UPI00315D76D6
MTHSILPFSERSDNAPASENLSTLFNANLDLLHPNDQNLLRYFGLGRSQLLKYLAAKPKAAVSAEAAQPSLLNYQRNLDQLKKIALPLDAPLNAYHFFWFDYRFYLYFYHLFTRDPRFSDTAGFLHAPRVLEGLQPYLMSIVRRVSKAVLTHALNHNILANRDLKLSQFSADLRNESTIANLASMYPVLFNLLFGILQDITNYIYRITQHFIEDHAELCNVFSTRLGEIESIRLGLGDAHGRQETVCEINSTGSSLIYKPRANKEAQFYSETLSLLQKRTGSEWFNSYTPKTLATADHCWIEKIPHVFCQTQHQRVLYYQRLGAQIAVIHALNGIDFHFENIIAHGTSPVLIDLECLFTAPLGAALSSTPIEPTLAGALQKARDSVFSSGFVPFAQHAINDVSGLTQQEHFTVTADTLVAQNGFYHLRKLTVERKSGAMHQPFPAGAGDNATTYLPALLEGFDFAYDSICSNREALLEHLDRNASHLTTRVLVKNTQRYVDFIALGLHPRFMQTQLDRELLLATLWSEAKGNPLKELAFSAEIDELQRLNVPRFVLEISSHQLNLAVRAPTPLILDQSPLDACRQKIQGLSPADKKLQTAVFRKCLPLLQVNDCPLNEAHLNRTVQPLSHAQALHGAEMIAAQLESLMIAGDDQGIRWLSFKTHPTTHKKYLSVMTNDLYSGMAGLGLFFLGLFSVTANTRYLQRTDQILKSLADTQAFFNTDTGYGGFHGLGGYVYLLWHRKVLSPTNKYDTQVDTLITRLCERPTDTSNIDFISGGCGTLAILSELHTRTPDNQLHSAISRRVDQIAHALTMDENGVLHKREGSPVLTGISHGISGAILSLCKAYEATKDSRIIPLVERCIRSENTLKRNGFWLDLRECSQSHHLTKWCHGDGGILLARLAVLSSMQASLSSALVEEINDDIACCVSNLLTHGLNKGYTLCHGDLGNLMCLSTFYRDRGDSDAIERVNQLMGAVTHDYFQSASIQRDPFPELGLMTGISGVGYSLLKHIDPSLPDVLSLGFTPPPRCC